MEDLLFIPILLVLISYPFLEVAVGLFLLSRVVKPGHLLDHASRWFLFFALVICPTVLLLAFETLEESIGIIGGRSGTWGPVSLLLWMGGAILLSVGLVCPKWLYRNALMQLSTLLLAGISLCYVYFTYAVESILVLIPFAAFVNYSLLTLHLFQSVKYIEQTPPPPRRKTGDGLDLLGTIINPTLKERIMSTNRVFLLGVIFVGVAIGWTFLGATVQNRTENLDQAGSAEITSLWGPKVLTQPGPFWSQTAGGSIGDAGMVVPAASKIEVDIQHENRDKGLLWFSTFLATFDGRFTIAPEPESAELTEGVFQFPLPQGVRGYDNVTVTIDEVPFSVPIRSITAGRLLVPILRDKLHVVHVRYQTYGQDAWLYSPTGQIERKTVQATAAADPAERYGRGATHQAVFTTETPPTALRNFSLTVRTNFSDIDYPTGTASPSKRAEPKDGGMQASWTYNNAVRSQAMGIAMPQRTNAGPITARMSYYAPISLLLFSTVLFLVLVLKKIALHPMHFLFLAAGFFSFHILLAYLVDILNIHASFWICSVVSVILVVSYMRLVVGLKFAVVYVAAAQLVYLVGFSYAFFWVGRTGLTVTILAIVTLFVLMQATGRLNWFEVFKAARRTPPLPSSSPPAWTGPIVETEAPSEPNPGE